MVMVAVVLFLILVICGLVRQPRVVVTFTTASAGAGWSSAVGVTRVKARTTRADRRRGDTNGPPERETGERRPRGWINPSASRSPGRRLRHLGESVRAIRVNGQVPTDRRCIVAGPPGIIRPNTGRDGVPHVAHLGRTRRL